MKKRQTIKWILVAAACAWIILYFAVSVFMNRDSLLYCVALNIAQCVCAPDPPDPEITRAEFPFSVSYSINGKTEIATGVLVCEYDGLKYEDGGCGTKERAWSSYIEGGDPIIYIAEDGTRIAIGIRRNTARLMGDESHDYNRDKAYCYVAYPEENKGLTQEEINEKYGVWVYLLFMGSPVENSFEESRRYELRNFDLSLDGCSLSSYMDYQGVKYTIDSKKDTAMVVGYGGDGDTVSIPEEIRGATVISIGEDAFAYSYELVHIDLPDSITDIGARAFEFCTELETVTVPDAVKSIGDHAFAYCYKLSAVTLSDRLETIGAGAFTNCLSLTEIHIPNTVTSIADDAFDVSDVEIYAPHPMEYYGFSPEYPRNWTIKQ